MGKLISLANFWNGFNESSKEIKHEFEIPFFIKICFSKKKRWSICWTIKIMYYVKCDEDVLFIYGKYFFSYNIDNKILVWWLTKYKCIHIKFHEDKNNY